MVLLKTLASLRQVTNSLIHQMRVTQDHHKDLSWKILS
jgi:hypothetical protein